LNSHIQKVSDTFGAMGEGIANFKFIVVGSSGVGKTAILRRLVDGSFTGESQTTVGVEFMATSVEVDGARIKLQIWDTAGQERFRSIAKAYFRSALGVILVFDLSSRQSFDELTHWLGDIHSLCDPNAEVTLVGNKSDLGDVRMVSPTETEAFANLHHLTYLETSALAGDNVQEAFRRTAATIYRKSLANKEVGKSQGYGQNLDSPENHASCC
jgi:small GTP-binding protein